MSKKLVQEAGLCPVCGEPVEVNQEFVLLEKGTFRSGSNCLWADLVLVPVHTHCLKEGK